MAPDLPTLFAHTATALGLAPPLLPLDLPSLNFRKQKYFYKGGLVWDENSSDGRYVKENCKPLKVSFWLPLSQLMLKRPQTLEQILLCSSWGSAPGTGGFLQLAQG